MVNDFSDRDDDAWPDARQLAAWRVPALHDDFTDGVLARARIPIARAGVRAHAGRGRMLAPIIAAVSAALAVAAIIVLGLGLELPQQRVDDGAPAGEPAVAAPSTKATTTLVPNVADDDGNRGRKDEGSTLHDPFDDRGSAPAAKASATLRIGVVAGRGPATVSIDGRVVGTTPIARERVTPGKHRIRWEWSDGDTFTQTISIDADEVKVVKGG